MSYSSEPAANALEADAFRVLVESRRAVRRFLPDAVPDQVITHCLETAVLAASSCNLQPWSFQVIRDPQLLERLHPVCLSQHAARAPLLIAVLARPDSWRQACADILKFWPEPTIPAPIERFYTRTAPFQYNQGPLGMLGWFKRQLIRVVGLRKPIMRKPNSHAEMRVWAVKSTALAAQNLMLAFQSHGYATCPLEGFDEVRLRRVLNLPKPAIPVMLLAVGLLAERGVYNPRLRFPLAQQVTWR